MTSSAARHPYRFRPIRACLAIFAALATLTSVLAPVGGDSASAASAQNFSAGYIISDSNLYDSNSMTAADVQSFLKSKVSTCEPWRDANPSDITCLKDYSTTTRQRSADAYCSGYAAARQTAAQIIDGVARSCGISQKVLIVLLQKENGLVTHTWPSSWRYQSATGYGCPDGQACDANYYGLFNQLYGAARQLKIYQAHPDWYQYRAGQTNLIRWSEKASCGGSNVYIQNQATAALYNYTPYQPNAAAKNAEYGTGDSCSSYGNRNFFLYYSDWFGKPTGYTVHGGINTAYQAGGGLAWLGEPTGAELTGLTRGGASQTFQNGIIFWSPAQGGFAVRGALLDKYGSLSWEGGRLGYPISNERKLTAGGYSQSFENGQIHWSSSSGAHPTTGGIQDTWSALGWENGVLGYPTSDEYTGLKRGGASQTYQGGSIFWSSTTGAYAVRGTLLAKYAAQSWESGPLGYPTRSEYTGLKNGGTSAEFENGQIHWTSATGAHTTKGAIQTTWASLGWENGRLGYPTGDEQSTSTGATQRFQGGTLTWNSKTGQTTVTS